MRDISEYLHNPQVLQAVKKMFESNETLSKEVEAMRREQVAQWAEKIISSTPERHGVQLIATQTDRTPEFVKDLAYNLRARSPKLVFVQGAVNDGKPMLTVMLGDEITGPGRERRCRGARGCETDAGRRRRTGVLRHGGRQEPRRAAGRHRQGCGADYGQVK